MTAMSPSLQRNGLISRPPISRPRTPLGPCSLAKPTPRPDGRCHPNSFARLRLTWLTAAGQPMSSCKLLRSCLSLLAEARRCRSAAINKGGKSSATAALSLNGAMVSVKPMNCLLDRTSILISNLAILTSVWARQVGINPPNKKPSTAGGLIVARLVACRPHPLSRTTLPG